VLDEANIMVEVWLFKAAGRNAYLAGCFAVGAPVTAQVSRTAEIMTMSK
jgi:hypothetical protein